MRKTLKINENRVFFVGVGGISMSALATLCYHNGMQVAGSDIAKNTETIKLEKIISVYYTHNKNNIIKFKPNLIIYTGAVNLNNPELKFATENGIKIMERSEFLGLVCNNYKNVIAVAGTHGKTTTTAMIAEIFIKANLKPTVHIGGDVVNLNGNLVVGENDYFITEACEYKKSFEHIKSTVSVVTNIECDHMDCYTDFNDLCKSFTTFVNKSKHTILVNDNPIKNNISTKRLTLLNSPLGYEVKNEKSINGVLSFDVFENGLYLGTFKLNVMGEYNIKNALNAIAVARHFKIKTDVIYSALSNFKGVMRRNEKLGNIKNTVMYADYCHHPTEILNSIKAFKQVYKKILCVFQPHTYSRTKTLITQFSTCFKGVSELIIFKTYPARESFDAKGSETEMFKKVKNRNKKLILDRQELLNVVCNFAPNYNAVIVLGAGDVYDIIKNGLTFN